MKVVSSRILGGGQAKVKQPDARLEIFVPASDRQPMDTVIALQLDGDALKIPALAVPPAISSGLFAPNVKRVVFLGDSITYAGHFVEDVAAYEHARFPDRKMEFINVGLPSETVSGLSEPGHAGGKFPRPDLHERLARVLDKTKPDLVFACYGMNDGIYLPFEETRFRLFRDGIEWLHTQVEKSGARIIHVTPPIFDEAKGGHEGYADVLDRYSDWLIAQRTNGWDVADSHFPMKQYLAAEREANTTFALTRDGIHPGDLGHWLMAQQILLYLGAKDAAAAGSIDELISRYPNGEDILHQDQKDQAVWKDAWLTAIGHKRPGMKPGAPIEIDPVTGSAHFMTNSVSKNGGNE
jgi:lysophospholipase L1-like esterase